MAFDYQDSFERLVAKANLLADRYNLLAENHRQAEARLAELEGSIAAKDKELETLRQEVEYLRMASVIAPTRDQVESTRAILSGLVREIDRCITDLSD